MDFNAIHYYITRHPRLEVLFKGIITSFDNTLILNKPSFYIYYVNVAGNPIGHYVALINDGYSILFFDSFGHSPVEYGIDIKGGTFNEFAYQASSSNNCGLYCIFVAYCILVLGIDYKSYLIPEKFDKNEEIIRRFKDGY